MREIGRGRASRAWTPHAADPHAFSPAVSSAVPQPTALRRFVRALIGLRLGPAAAAKGARGSGVAAELPVGAFRTSTGAGDGWYGAPGIGAARGHFCARPAAAAAPGAGGSGVQEQGITWQRSAAPPGSPVSGRRLPPPTRPPLPPPFLFAHPGCCPAPAPLQLRKQLNDQRAQLTLFHSPFRTLAAFGASAANSAARGAAWLVSHPLTLFILVRCLCGFPFRPVVSIGSAHCSLIAVRHPPCTQQQQPFEPSLSLHTPICWPIRPSRPYQPPCQQSCPNTSPRSIAGAAAAGLWVPQGHRHAGARSAGGRSLAVLHRLVDRPGGAVLHWPGHRHALGPALLVPSHAQGGMAERWGRVGGCLYDCPAGCLAFS